MRTKRFLSLLLALAMLAAMTISVSAAEIEIIDLKLVKDFAGPAEDVVDALTANGLQGAKLTLRNTTENAKNVAVIYAVYGANGQLTDVVYANDTVAAQSEAEIGTGLTLAAADTVKAFVWDGISSLKPHTNATFWEINATENEEGE